MSDNTEYTKVLMVGKIEIGISRSQKWVFRNGNTVHEYINDSVNDFILGLPILETSYQDLIGQITEAVKADKGLTEVKILIESFPIKSILDTAFKSNSEYWVTLALNWCENIDDLKCYTQELEDIIANKKYSQGVRHKALRLMKKTK